MKKIFKIPIKEFNKSNLIPLNGLAFSYRTKQGKILISVTKVEKDFVTAEMK